jgi:hypothetical protein
MQRGQGQALEAIIKRRNARTRLRQVASEDLEMLKRRQAAEVHVKDASSHILVPDRKGHLAAPEEELKQWEKLPEGSKGSTDIIDGSWDGIGGLAVWSHPLDSDALGSADEEARSDSAEANVLMGTVDLADLPVAKPDAGAAVVDGAPEEGEPVPEVATEISEREGEKRGGAWLGGLKRLVGLARYSSSVSATGSWDPHALEQEPRDGEEKDRRAEASAETSRDGDGWDWWGWLPPKRRQADEDGGRDAAAKVSGTPAEKSEERGNAWWGWAAAIPAALGALARAQGSKSIDDEEDGSERSAAAAGKASGCKSKQKPLETVILSPDLPIEEIAAEIARVKRGEQEKTEEAKRKAHEAMMTGPLGRLRAFTANVGNLNKPEIVLLCLLSGGVLVLLAVVAYRLELYVEYQRLFTEVERVRPW